MHPGGESGGGAAGSGRELVEESQWEQKKGPHGIWAPKVALLTDHTRRRGSEHVETRKGVQAEELQTPSPQAGSVPGEFEAPVAGGV